MTRLLLVAFISLCLGLKVMALDNTKVETDLFCMEKVQKGETARIVVIKSDFTSSISVVRGYGYESGPLFIKTKDESRPSITIINKEGKFKVTLFGPTLDFIASGEHDSDDAFLYADIQTDRGQYMGYCGGKLSIVK